MLHQPLHSHVITSARKGNDKLQQVLGGGRTRWVLGNLVKLWGFFFFFIAFLMNFQQSLSHKCLKSVIKGNPVHQAAWPELMWLKCKWSASGLLFWCRERELCLMRGEGASLVWELRKQQERIARVAFMGRRAGSCWTRAGTGWRVVGWSSGVYVCTLNWEGRQTGRLLVRRRVYDGLGVGCVDFWGKGWVWLWPRYACVFTHWRRAHTSNFHRGTKVSISTPHPPPPPTNQPNQNKTNQTNKTKTKKKAKLRRQNALEILESCVVETVWNKTLCSPGDMGTPSWDQISQFFPCGQKFYASVFACQKIITLKKSDLTVAERAKHFPCGLS